MARHLIPFKRHFSEKRNINIIRKLDLLLIRHAESTNNTLHTDYKNSSYSDPDWKSKRHADCNISARGRKQLQYLSEFVENGHWNELLPSQGRYYCSPMKRCLETMNSITSKLPTRPIVSVQSNMYEFGGCYDHENDKVITKTGMTKFEIESNYPGYECPADMKDGWYHHPHRETRIEFEKRSIHVASCFWNLLKSEPILPPGEIHSTSTAIFVLHGYLLSTILNQLLFSQPNSCVFIHNNTGITHVELIEFQSGAMGCSVKYQNSIPHLIGKESEVKSGDALVRDQWIKIFQ